MPDPSPNKNPAKVTVRFPPMTPVVMAQPNTAHTREITFAAFSFSLNSIRENSITNAGAVYSSTAATESELSAIEVK